MKDVLYSVEFRWPEPRVRGIKQKNQIIEIRIMHISITKYNRPINRLIHIGLYYVHCIIQKCKEYNLWFRDD